MIERDLQKIQQTCQRLDDVSLEMEMFLSKFKKPDSVWDKIMIFLSGIVFYQAIEAFLKW